MADMVFDFITIGSLLSKHINKRIKNLERIKVLHVAITKEPATIKDIVNILWNFNKKYLFQIIKIMEQENLIEKRKSKQDKRKINIYATEKGNEFYNTYSYDLLNLEGILKDILKKNGIGLKETQTLLKAIIEDF